MDFLLRSFGGGGVCLATLATAKTMAKGGEGKGLEDGWLVKRRKRKQR